MSPGDLVTWHVTDTLAVPATVLVVDGNKVQLQRGDRRPWARIDEVEPREQLV